ncbi:hypothetical protein GCK32_011813 [Trichostrongylus colubriformis]|uniref:Uncharacterized protein n=1 Tax=Trichostrongylus colubriformis TaxID=6319 RepID=A0AAN8FVW0_TRICO
MVVCVQEWKRSHAQRSFYSLMISQGIVDIVVMVNFFIFVTLRTSQLFNDIYWSYQRYYIPEWCFNQAYISIINTSHRWVLPVLQWMIPAAYSVPLLILSNATFDTPETLEVMANHSNITLATSMAIIFVSLTFIGCGFCYGAILEFLMRNRLDCSEAIKRERRLYIQMLGLFVAFVLIFVYNILQFTFSLYTNEGPILVMRTIFPVISCFFSYVNSWMTLILNHDIRRKMLILLGYRSKQIQSSVKLSSSQKVLRAFEPIRF